MSYGFSYKGSIFMRLCIVMSRRCLVPHFVRRKQIKTYILLKILSGAQFRYFNIHLSSSSDLPSMSPLV
jgi:hypothetical protein